MRVSLKLGGSPPTPCTWKSKAISHHFFSDVLELGDSDIYMFWIVSIKINWKFKLN